MSLVRAWLWHALEGPLGRHLPIPKFAATSAHGVKWRDGNSVLCTPLLLSLNSIKNVATSRPNPENCGSRSTCQRKASTVTSQVCQPMAGITWHANAYANNNISHHCHYWYINKVCWSLPVGLTIKIINYAAHEEVFCLCYEGGGSCTCIKGFCLSRLLSLRGWQQTILWLLGKPPTASEAML